MGESSPRMRFDSATAIFCIVTACYCNAADQPVSIRLLYNQRRTKLVLDRTDDLHSALSHIQQRVAPAGSQLWLQQIDGTAVISLAALTEGIELLAHSSEGGLMLNLGCGGNMRKGWLNVDSAPHVQPDVLMSLAEFPWPWQNNSVDSVMATHVLEHLGSSVDEYLRFWQELYRVSSHNATIGVSVPHHRHDNWFGDPTHIRPVTVDSLLLLSRKKNLAWGAYGASNSKLAIQLGVDFEVTRVNLKPDEIWMRDNPKAKYGTGLWDHFQSQARYLNNVIEEVQVVLRVVKTNESYEAW